MYRDEWLSVTDNHIYAWRWVKDRYMLAIAADIRRFRELHERV